MWGYVALLIFLNGIVAVGVRFQPKCYDKLDKKDLLICLYPSVAFWLDKTGYFESELSRKKIEMLQLLHPGKDIRKEYYLKTYRKIAILYTILYLSAILGVLVQGANRTVILKKYGVNRPDVGFGTREELLHVRLEEEGKRTEEEVTVQVCARNYSEKELLKFKEEAKQYVLEKILGENESLEEVNKPLHLITRVPENPFDISWELGTQKLIGEKGEIYNRDIKKKMYTSIRMRLAYKAEEEYMEVPIGVLPRVSTWQEKAREDFMEMVEQINEDSKEKASYTLPSKIGNVEVSYMVKKEGIAKKIIISGILSCIGMWMYWEESVKKNKKLRDYESQLDYPGIVYKLTLLLGAGITFKAAWYRTIQDYEKEKKSGKKRFAYEEMIVTWNEMQNGVPEIEAFSEFGKRMKMRSYLRFSALISQNLKKGTKGFLMQLESEAREAQEERKQMARRLGEEAGTKLLFPMLIMLIIVLVIVMLPAFLNFSEGGL